MSTIHVIGAGIHTAIRLLASKVKAAMLEVELEPLRSESANINVMKSYKPRRLKMDTVHLMARRLNKMRSRDPGYRRKLAVRRKKYLMKNGRQLKKRAQHVREIRKLRGL